MVGCPVDITVDVERVKGTPTRARTAWTRAYGRRGSLGVVVLPVRSAKPAGAAPDEVTVRVVPERSGTYYYHLQLEDEEGRRSNVLSGAIWISPLWNESRACGGSDLPRGSSWGGGSCNRRCRGDV